MGRWSKHENILHDVLCSQTLISSFQHDDFVGFTCFVSILISDSRNYRTSRCSYALLRSSAVDAAKGKIRFYFFVVVTTPRSKAGKCSA